MTTLAGLNAIAPGLGSEELAKLEPSSQVISVNTSVTKGALPHIWEKCVGSDRAVVALREQWLSDLVQVRETAGMKSVRFHGLFNDEMGVWPSGSKQPNFLYVDMVFDAMLARGIKPLVELSFMPGALASGTRTLLWYRGNTTPPKDLSQWGELVERLTKHLVDRYGIHEVSTWNFEVWNEPNIIFWSGTKEEYFELYRQSANALKKVDRRLRVGGPSTAMAAWVGDLLGFCAAEQIPIDFASTHVYPDDPQARLFGDGVHYPIEEVIPRALAKVREEIRASQLPDIPLYLTEWGSQNPAFIAHTIKGTIGLAEIMSYWTFSNVYEELGVPKSFLNNGFGLLGMRGVPRPSFNTFALLHRLGDVRLACDDGPILATRRADGSLAILLWNLIPQDPKHRGSMGDPLVQSEGQFATQGAAREVTLRLEGKRGPVRISRVDTEHGNLNRAYRTMGSPEYPTAKQIEELKSASSLPEPERTHLNAQGEITLSIPPNGVALLELR